LLSGEKFKTAGETPALLAGRNRRDFRGICI
jgi:hypothetical protein